MLAHAQLVKKIHSCRASSGWKSHAHSEKIRTAVTWSRNQTAAFVET